MTTDIKLDPESLAVIVQKALVDSIPPETMEKILSDAVAQILLVPEDKRSHWEKQSGPLKSPLTQAFEQAINSATMTIVREMVANDERIVAKIKEIAGEALNPLLDGSYDLSAKVGEAIGAAIGEAWHDRSVR